MEITVNNRISKNKKKVSPDLKEDGFYGEDGDIIFIGENGEYYFVGEVKEEQ